MGKRRTPSDAPSGKGKGKGKLAKITKTPQSDSESEDPGMPSTVTHQTMLSVMIKMVKGKKGTKNPNKILRCGAEVASRIGAIAPDRVSYKGSMTFESGPPIPTPVLNAYLFSRATAGAPVPEEDINDILAPEFATNLKKVGHTLSLVTTKYIGMPTLPLEESTIDVLDIDSGYPIVLDFFFNIIAENLRSLDEIEAFLDVKKPPPRGMVCYLMTKAQEKVLIRNGHHESFLTEEDQKKTKEFLGDVKAYFEGIHTLMKKV